jgi:hypothetical protein
MRMGTNRMGIKMEVLSRHEFVFIAEGGWYGAKIASGPKPKRNSQSNEHIKY